MPSLSIASRTRGSQSASALGLALQPVAGVHVPALAGVAAKLGDAGLEAAQDVDQVGTLIASSIGAPVEVCP